MAVARSLTEPKGRPRKHLLVKMLNQISTWFSQLPWSGVNTNATRRWLASHAFASSPVRVDIVGDNDDLAEWVGGDDQIEEAKHAWQLPIRPHLHQHVSCANVERSEDVACTVPFVLELDARETSRGHRSRRETARLRLDARLLVQAQHRRVGRWRDVEFADGSGFLVEVVDHFSNSECAGAEFMDRYLWDKSRRPDAACWEELRRRA